MQIDLVCIGKIKEPYLRDGIAEYVKRLTGLCQIRITEYHEERLKDSASTSEIEMACIQEGNQLLKNSDSAGLIIALDPKGKKISSVELAGYIKKWEIDGPHQCMVLIGGPHGLSNEVRNKSDILLSLSDMTFPHQMVRLIILEQIYRAYTINKGLPYHR